MARWQNDAELDAALNYVKVNATQVFVCSAQPTTYAGLSGITLASRSGLDSGDFTGPANGDIDGRKLTVNAQSGISISSSGTATHVALASGSVLLYVTVVTPLALTAGNTVDIGSWIIEYGDSAYNPASPGTDTEAPVVTSFTIPSDSSSLTVPVVSFSATDNVGVTGYLITESATTPSTSNPNWSGSAWTSYTFGSEGAKTLYAWAKDAQDNISASVSDNVQVTLPAGGGEGWTLTANFDQGVDGDRAQGTSGFGYAGTGTLFDDDGPIHSGSRSCLVHWNAGDEGWGVSHGEFPNFPEQLVNGSECWYRAYFYFPSGFNFNCSPVNKVLRIRIMTSTGGHIGMLSILNNYQGMLVGSNEVADIQPDTGVYFNSNAWTCVEMYIKLGTAGNGIQRIWKDGVLAWENTTARTINNTSDRGDVALLFTNWNGGSPANQDCWVDDVIVTTVRPNNQDAQGHYMIGT